jgi:hypothetical protein
MAWIGGCGRPRKATAVQVTAVRTHDAIESHLTIVFAALPAARETQDRTGLASRNLSMTSRTGEISGTKEMTKLRMGSAGCDCRLWGGCLRGRSPGPAEHEVVQDVRGVLTVLASAGSHVAHRYRRST